MLVASAQELMQGERDFVRMRCAPGDDAFELEQIVGDGADLHQLGFDDVNFSHRKTSMAQTVQYTIGRTDAVSSAVAPADVPIQTS